MTEATEQPAPITRAGLKTMTTREIETARQNGDLDHLLNPNGDHS